MSKRIMVRALVDTHVDYKLRKKGTEFSMEIHQARGLLDANVLGLVGEKKAQLPLPVVTESGALKLEGENADPPAASSKARSRK